MGSAIEVIVIADDALVDVARARLAHLERSWSRFLPDSDISRLNTAGGRAVEVDPSTVVLVQHLVQAARVTDGRFDPTLLPLLVDLGYGASWDDPDRFTSLAPGVHARCDLDGVLVDPAAGVVQLAAGTTLDPGGLGKGLAADLVVARTARRRRERRPRERRWRRPGGRPITDRRRLDDRGGGPQRRRTRCSVRSAAGRWRRHLEHVAAVLDERTARTRHHLLDPATGTSVATGLASVTVVAGTAAWAEAWTKVVMVAGAVPSLALLDEHGLGAMAVALDGAVMVNDSWKGFAA